VDALLSAVGPEIAVLGQELVARVGDVGSDRGGVTAVVADPGFGRADVWVGVVGGELVGECDCPVEGLCAHAVALALAAPERGAAFSSIPFRRGSDPEQEGFLSVAGVLGRRKLDRLVAEHAAKDRHFAAKLLAAAGRLREPSAEDVEAVRRMVEEAAAIPEGNDQWELHDLVRAGRDVVAELEVLAERPATVELLDVAEEAVVVWTASLAHLRGYWDDADVDLIGEALADLHLKLCEACDLPPAELAARLGDLLGRSGEDVFLDIPDAYEDLLGDEGVEG
jgi:hypothetical protein